MGAPTLNYALRDTKGELSGNLGWLFTMYWLHCDQLLRCYPSNNLLKKETGIASNSTLSKHRDSLIAMKALIIVPNEKRITPKELEQHHRKIVYQLTGAMVLSDNKIIPTVNFINPDSFLTHISLLSGLDFDLSIMSEAFRKDIEKWIEDNKVTDDELSMLQKLKVKKLYVTDFSIRSSTLSALSNTEKDIAPEKSDAPKPPLKPDDPSKQEDTQTPEKEPKARKRNLLYDAIVEVWGYEKGRNANMQKFLTGQFEHKKDGDYYQYQIDADNPVTPDELLQWAKDVEKHKDHAIYEKLEKVQSSIYEWRRWKHTKSNGTTTYFKATETDEPITESDRQAALDALKGDNS